MQDPHSPPVPIEEPKKPNKPKKAKSPERAPTPRCGSTDLLIQYTQQEQVGILEQIQSVLGLLHPQQQQQHQNAVPQMLIKKQAPYPMQFSGVHSPQPTEVD